jgi:hypothetical protein
MLSQENESLKDKIKEMKTERKIMAIRHTRVEDWGHKIFSFACSF